MPSLMECKNVEGIAKLRHDSFHKGDFWIISDGFNVTIAEQRVGESPTQSICVPKATFDYFVKKYTEQRSNSEGLTEMKTDAYFSSDRKHRYWLIRIWDESLPIFANIGVNPSTADEKENDPTIRKDIGFAERLGGGGLLKLNVGAFRATDPRKWRKAWNRIGDENTANHLVACADHFKVQKTIAAWGKNGNYAIGQCEAIIRAFAELWCFGKNPDGSPRHTLMLPYTTPLEVFTKRA